MTVRTIVSWAAIGVPKMNGLDSNGLVPIKRSPDSRRRPEPYTGWDDLRHADFIDRLLRIIESTKIMPFACGVSPQEWSKLSKNRIVIFTNSQNERLQKPLVIALHRIIVRIASYAYSHKVMHFVMDLDKGKPSVQHAMLSTFADIKYSLKHDRDPLADRIGDLTFAESDKAIPLQAADLLAYEAHRYAKSANGDPNHPVRLEYRRALSRFRSKDDFWFFDEKRFTGLNRVLTDAVLESVHAKQSEK